MNDFQSKPRFNRHPKAKLKKYYAKQMIIPEVAKLDEPHNIIRCAACDEPKHLEFHRDGDDNMYYICSACGFKSEAVGKAPYYLD